MTLVKGFRTDYINACNMEWECLLCKSGTRVRHEWSKKRIRNRTSGKGNRCVDMCNKSICISLWSSKESLYTTTWSGRLLSVTENALTVAWNAHLPPYANLDPCLCSLTSQLSLYHDIRHFNVFFSSIFSSDLKDNVLLMFWNRLLADSLYQLAHLEWHTVLRLAGWVKAGI